MNELAQATIAAAAAAVAAEPVDGIRSAVADGIRYVIFSHPDKLNVLTPAALGRVTTIARSAAGTERGIVFTGSGRAFCAGMHLDCFAGLDGVSSWALIDAVGQMLEAVRTCPLPTIAAINGYCLGAAFELAMTCDVRIAASGAQVGLPEVKVGIPSVLDASLLIRYLGLSAAKEMILTGDLYEAGSPATSAMFSAIVPPAELAATAADFMARIARHTRQVTATQKALFETWINSSHAVGLRVSRDEFARVFSYPETAAQVSAARAGLGRGPG